MTRNEINWSKVPVAHMTDGIRLYVERGIPPGHFLTAVLSNNLMEAVNRADAENAKALCAWTQFLYWELPRGCYGSPGLVSEWIKNGGLQGHDAAKTV